MLICYCSCSVVIGVLDVGRSHSCQLLFRFSQLRAEAKAFAQNHQDSLTCRLLQHFHTVNAWIAAAFVLCCRGVKNYAYVSSGGMYKDSDEVGLAP